MSLFSIRSLADLLRGDYKQSETVRAIGRSLWRGPSRMEWATSS
jgi:hypothetical protein